MILDYLHHHPHVRGAPGRFGADLVPAVTGHHDEALRAESGRRRQRVPEHAAAAQGVQHLRDPRSHPRALARGEDDDSDRARLAHDGKSPRVARRLAAGPREGINPPNRPAGTGQDASGSGIRQRMCLPAPHPQDTVRWPYSDGRFP